MQEQILNGVDVQPQQMRRFLRANPSQSCQRPFQILKVHG